MAFKVLIIDDTAVIREFLTEVMTDAGFEVDIASNGQDGYEKALKSDYVMIFCDIHMPVMNGLDTIRKIKQIKPELPVVMTDSFPDKLAKQATDAGALCCLAKPFALDELRKTVSRIMSARESKVK
jgi:two-component system response regulator (stage 0 sporulation protein F)